MAARTPRTVLGAVLLALAAGCTGAPEAATDDGALSSGDCAMPAVSAEGVSTGPGVNKPLHLHPLFNECDIYGHGRPTRIANSDRDLRQPRGSLPVSEGIDARTYRIPWFKRHYPELIEQYANAFKKVAENHKELLADDPGNDETVGRWSLFRG